MKHYKTRYIVSTLKVIRVLLNCKTENFSSDSVIKNY